jgi:hypothetical protein
MLDSIFSTYWGDSAAILYPASAVPESPSSILMYLLNMHMTGAHVFTTLIILGFISTWVICFFIAKKEFSNILTAIFFATIITFAPLRLRYSMEWPTLVSWGFCVGTIYLIYKYLETSKISQIILAGVLFCLAFTEHPYLGAILSLVVGISTLIYLLITRQKKHLASFAIIVLVMTVFAIPGAYNVLKTRDYRGSEVNYLIRGRNEADLWAYSARPWNYLIPDIGNPILGDTAVKLNYWIWSHPPYYLTEPFFPKEHTLYLGITLCLLSLFTLYLTFIKKDEFILKYKNLTIYFLIIGIVAFLFSMPPYIGFNNIKFYFPSTLLYQILPQLRAYTRFGILVFISNSILAAIAFNYILQLTNKNVKYLLISAITILIAIEFATSFFAERISDKPTTPYQWLAAQSGDFTHLEIPRRTNYTDSLYETYYKKKLINKYLNTPESVSEIEDSIIYDLGDSKDLVCNRFVKELSGKYIVYHDERIIKQNIVDEFVKTGKVTESLKIALSESWGQPIWGNHLVKSDDDLKKELDRKNLLQKLKNDPKLVQVAEFKQGELGSLKHFNANDLDAVTIFEINPNYCE